MDDKDIGITIVAAGTQIRQVGKDQMPTDFSKEENAQIFFQDMGVWGQKMAEDKVCTPPLSYKARESNRRKVFYLLPLITTLPRSSYFFLIESVY